MFTQEALETLLAQANPQQEIATEEDIASQLVVTHEDWQLQSLEQFQDAPNRIKRQPKLHTAEAFCAYVNDFAKVPEDNSVVYLNVQDGIFRAVLDHHAPCKPAWADHCATFTPKMSQEWRAWKAIHRCTLSQLQLAEFIEENLDAIVHPEPNVMLKAALDFQVNEKMTLASATNLDDGGVRFNFTKENVKKQVEFPHRITIQIPVFENEESVKLDARVRYKASGEGVLTFVISFAYDIERIERDQLRGIAATISESIDGVTQYEGTF